MFLLAFTLAGTAALVLVRRAETRAAHAEIEELEDDASDLVEQGRTPELIRKIDAPQHDPSRLYRLLDASGRRLGGLLPPPPAPLPDLQKHWTVFTAHRLGPPHDRAARVLVFVHPEPGGLRLMVGEDLSLRERQDAPLLALTFAAAAIVSGLGMVGGIAVAGRTLRRADGLTRAVQSFAAGSRNARIPVGQRSTTELDDLARALNDMMERETRLVEGLRQTSTAIAHDLRRPLAHHNQMIVTALARPPSEPVLREALIRASSQVEEVLATFQALLHIAELEAGAPGLALMRVDLNEVAARIADAYQPLAEEGLRSLLFEPAEAPALILGDARSLGRMIANLLENALAHTPQGSMIVMSIFASPPRLQVVDNGAGVPDSMLDRIFERFVRLDASRSAPGSGLGLALAAATATAFGGALIAENARPGLRIIGTFPPTDSSTNILHSNPGDWRGENRTYGWS